MADALHVTVDQLLAELEKAREAGKQDATAEVLPPIGPVTPHRAYLSQIIHPAGTIFHSTAFVSDTPVSAQTLSYARILAITFSSHSLRSGFPLPLMCRRCFFFFWRK